MATIEQAIGLFEEGLPGLETYKKASSTRLRILVGRYTREIDGCFRMAEKAPSVLYRHLIALYDRHQTAALRILRSRGWIPAWGSVNVREADGSIEWRRGKAV